MSLELKAALFSLVATAIVAACASAVLVGLMIIAQSAFN